MSFEGYYQVLCNNGHYHVLDVLEYPVFEKEDYRLINSFLPFVLFKCPDCGELANWYNFVNVTNGSYCSCNKGYLTEIKGCEYCDHGRIDGYVEIEKESKEKYKIPQNKGTKVNVT